MARSTSPSRPADPATPKNLGGRPKKTRDDPGLAAAIAAAGSIGALAVAAGVTTGAASIWKRVPSRAVVAIAAALHIPRHTLRPDLYTEAGEPIANP